MQRDAWLGRIRVLCRVGFWLAGVSVTNAICNRFARQKEFRAKPERAILGHLVMIRAVLVSVLAALVGLRRRFGWLVVLNSTPVLKDRLSIRQFGIPQQCFHH